jgi:hypothetical protein
MIAYVIYQTGWPAVEMVRCGFATPILRIFSQRKPKLPTVHSSSVRIPKTSTN